MSLLTLTLLERAVKEKPTASPADLLGILSERIASMLNPDEQEHELKDGFEGVLCRFIEENGSWMVEYAAARRPF
jgi:hypothetical protein